MFFVIHFRSYLTGTIFIFFLVCQHDYSFSPNFLILECFSSFGIFFGFFYCSLILLYLFMYVLQPFTLRINFISCIKIILLSSRTKDQDNCLNQNICHTYLSENTLYNLITTYFESNFVVVVVVVNRTRNLL